MQSREQNRKLDISRHVRMVPLFQELEVDKYFQGFEKITKNLEWPEMIWSMLLQSVLKCEAQEAYSALPLAYCRDYENV